MLVSGVQQSDSVIHIHILELVLSEKMSQMSPGEDLRLPSFGIFKIKFLSLDSIFLEHFQTQDPAFVSTSQIFQDSFCGFPLPWRCSPDPFQPGT